MMPMSRMSYQKKRLTFLVNVTMRCSELKTTMFIIDVQTACQNSISKIKKLDKVIQSRFILMLS